MQTLFVWWIGTLIAFGILSWEEKPGPIMSLVCLFLWPMIIGLAIGRMVEGIARK